MSRLVENFGPPVTSGHYRIWKVGPENALWLAIHDEFPQELLTKPWCLTTFLGTYRFDTFQGALNYLDELLSPYEPIDQPDGCCGGLLQ